jgi:molecular chaperone DnaK (HSP70)
MRLLIDTSRVSFTVGREAQPKTDQNGVQRVERNTNIPMWSVQLVAMDDSGAEVITVTVTAPQPPKVATGQPVTPVELQAIPWAQNGRNGVAYRASDLKPANATKSNSAPAAS